MIPDGVQVIITTPAFIDGQAAAWRDFGRDRWASPNRALLARLDPEFASGYLYEWSEHCAPELLRLTALLTGQDEDDLPDLD